MSKKEIINLAVIAHVDAGKSTLVDAFLNQSGVFRENEEVVDCVMDSNDLERERGITIYSKNCAIEYNGVKINIVDTPGHADFSSEVERVIKAVDSAILIVDAAEGPMPQTRFVLKKSLEKGIKPIVFINKIDKNNQRAEEVRDEILDLFIDLAADDEQLEFPVIYGIAVEGKAFYDLDGDSEDLSPLFETIIKTVDSYPDLDDKALKMQVYDLAYDDYLGRIGIGRVYQGTIRDGQEVSVFKRDGSIEKAKISNLKVYHGLSQNNVEEAKSGDIVSIAGIADISIGETLSEPGKVEAMPMIEIAEPTLAMYFLVNDSPFAGQEGEYLTTRHLKARLERELEVNVGLRVEKAENTEAFKVSGRGELHLSILLENMRREGYEVSVSKPEVLMKEINGKKHEPIEKVMIEVPEKYSGTVINKLNQRKGIMQSMLPDGSYLHLEYLVPTRGLIGFRSEFINDTSGEGTLIRSFSKYEEFKGEVPKRQNGVLVSNQMGTAMGYALSNLEERGVLFIEPGTKVYEGMIIGLNNRDNDLAVNACKNKKLTNVRASGSDDSINLSPAKKFTLEQALEFIEDDELVEITPEAIRLRKKILNEKMRLRNSK
ncbi:translational GTPase TypA [Halanaerobium sp. Z-7514]|uniref:Large ribosomal subunit assembly factor BipA n=1 Tax=Halanaerobium polyolivorans TaxID=2886943 RepID=A0AAW4WXU7_9FIRM|nr:translational GTPase TypA [Halanaerobium polyolivorans]MCC3144254.1 translational GTPase TypA [Halanaerobium polyolivorans]RQD72549.1 MAG: translational GTPase TypA [Halanaerobium sp. MSAO_Bac5]